MRQRKDLILINKTNFMYLSINYLQDKEPQPEIDAAFLRRKRFTNIEISCKNQYKRYTAFVLALFIYI